MDNNYQSNSNSTPDQGNSPYYNPYNAPAENTTYPGAYNAVQENSPYANPYAPAGNTTYSNPYSTTPPVSSPYANPYANPYAVPTPLPPKKSKKGLLIGLIAGGVVMLIIITLALYFTSDSYKYGAAEDLLAEGKYDRAIAAFEELGDYKDSAEKIDICKYEKACFLLESSNYEEAIELFYEVEEFEDSENKIVECNRRMLYDYLYRNGEVTTYSSKCTYRLKTDGNEISLGYTKSDPSQAFSLTFDMTSAEGYFLYEWKESPRGTTSGDCTLSELKTYGNDTEIDKFTGDTYMMQDLTDSSFNMSCIYFSDLLDSTYLGLTPFDLGFTSIY